MPPTTNPYRDTSDEDLQAEVQRRKITVSENASRDEIIDALLASDLVTEEAQSKMDAPPPATEQPSRPRK